jgi:hypothetical protein
MKITHRAPADAPARLSTAAEPAAASLTLPSFDKAPRLSCCCRLSELMPKVREVHDAVRAARLATEAAPAEAA